MFSETDQRQAIDSPPADSVFYEVASHWLSEQLRHAAALDTKITVVASVEVLIFPVVIGLLALQHDQPHRLPGVMLLLLGLAFVSYCFSAFFALRAFRVRSWQFLPDLALIREHCRTHGPGESHVWIGNQCVTAVQHNAAIMRQKSHDLRWALWCLAGEVVLLSLVTIGTLLSPLD